MSITHQPGNVLRRLANTLKPTCTCSIVTLKCIGKMEHTVAEAELGAKSNMTRDEGSMYALQCRETRTLCVGFNLVR